MTPALTGIVAGLAATLALSRVLEKLVFGIGTVDLLRSRSRASCLR